MTAEVQQVNSVQSMQVLSFELDKDWYGVEISGIQEVLEYRVITKVPRTPSFMLGVINLRGKVIPVVDLRQHFNMNIAEPTIDSCIIIIHVEIDGEMTPLGIMADRVQEVVEIAVEDINPPPRLGNRINSAFIYGMARHEDDFIILLRLARIFSHDEMHNVLNTPSGSPEDEAE